MFKTAICTKPSPITMYELSDLLLIEDSQLLNSNTSSAVMVSLALTSRHTSPPHQAHGGHFRGRDRGCSSFPWSHIFYQFVVEQTTMLYNAFTEWILLFNILICLLAIPLVMLLFMLLTPVLIPNNGFSTLEPPTALPSTYHSYHSSIIPITVLMLWW